MNKKSVKIWALILTAVLVVGGLYYREILREEEQKESALYSVILYQNMDNEWQQLMDGIRQAEEDFGVNVRYVFLEEEASAREQAELIRREINGGASGVLLAAVDSDGLGQELEELNLLAPVVTVETGVEGAQGKIALEIAADDYQMGRILGERILEDMEEETNPQWRNVTVIAEYLERESVRRRYEGVKDVLENAGDKVEILEIARQEGDFDLELFIETSFGRCGKYIVALDKFCTQEAAAAVDSGRQVTRIWQDEEGAVQEESQNPKVYGIGATGQTINDLDYGRLEALVFQNEFHMGYEGIQALADKEQKGYTKSSVEIMYKLVTKEGLYEPENERLLFPGA